MANILNLVVISMKGVHSCHLHNSLLMDKTSVLTGDSCDKEFFLLNKILSDQSFLSFFLTGFLSVAVAVLELTL